MSSTPLLRVIDGGGAKAEGAPAIPPARESERLFPDFHKGRHGAFVHVVAVSLILHGAIIVGSSLWREAGDERIVGGSNEEIVIEGIDVILFNQMPNVASPLVEAPEIRDADVAESVAEADVALLEPQKPAAVPADRPMPATDDFPIKPQFNDEILETDIEPAFPVETTSGAAIPDSEPAIVTRATPVEAELPAAAFEIVAATTADSGEVVTARPIDATATTPTDAVQAAVTVPAEKSQPTNAKTTKVLEPAKVKAEPEEQAIKAANIRAVARSADTAPRAVENHAVAPVTPDTAPIETVAEDELLKPVDETIAVAAAEVHPDPPLPPKRPLEAEKPKATAVKQKTASRPAPPRPASAAEPVARGPGKAEAGAGGKTKKAQGTANLASYQAKLVAHLRRYRSYPDAARRRRLQGTASVSFTINGSGHVVGVSLARGTGHAILDREALAMVRRASPFPAIPSALGKSRVTVRAPVRFDIR